MKKNGKIELLRFLFSVAVLCFHVLKYLIGEPSLNNGINFSLFPYGSMGVEFFFVVSGFLMAASVFSSINRKDGLTVGESTQRFMSRKISSLLPIHLIVFVLLFAVCSITRNWNLGQIAKNAVDSIPNLLLIQMAGFRGTPLNHIEWYLSVMLIVMLIIYPLLKKFYSTFVRIIAPLIVIFILGWLSYRCGRLTGVNVWEGIAYRSMFRGLAEISLGTICFEISRAISTRSFTSRGRLVLTALELGIWMSVFILITLTLPRRMEMYMLMLIAIGVTITFSGQTLGTKLFDNRFIQYIGKLSLPIYICQLIPIELAMHYFTDLPMKVRVISVVLATIILSALLLQIDTAIRNTINKKKSSIK